MLLKLTTFAFIGLMALPSFAPRDVALSVEPVTNVDEAGTPYNDGATAVGFVTSLAQDVAGICYRQPEVCAKGAHLIDGALIRAEHGFRIAYAMVIKHRNETQ